MLVSQMFNMKKSHKAEIIFRSTIILLHFNTFLLKTSYISILYMFLLSLPLNFKTYNYVQNDSLRTLLQQHYCFHQRAIRFPHCSLLQCREPLPPLQRFSNPRRRLHPYRFVPLDLQKILPQDPQRGEGFHCDGRRQPTRHHWTGRD